MLARAGENAVVVLTPDGDRYLEDTAEYWSAAVEKPPGKKYPSTVSGCFKFWATGQREIVGSPGGPGSA